MALINLLGTNTSGKSLAATAQERMNLYYEPIPQADKSGMVAYGWPGSVKEWNEISNKVGGDNVCGIYYSKPSYKLFVATTDRLLAYDYFGGSAPSLISTYPYPAATTIIPGQKVTFAELMSPYELLFASSGQNFILRWNGTAVNKPTLSSLGALNFVCSVHWFGSRFVIVTQRGTFCWSDLNNGNSWPALNFATAESNSDGLVHGEVLRDNLFLFGQTTIEAWQTSPDLNLPYTRVLTMPDIGLESQGSVAVDSGSVYFIGLPQSGLPGVFVLSGYEPAKISTPDLERDIASNGLSSEMSGYILNHSGRSFYVLNDHYNDAVLSYDKKRTFVFDSLTNVWSRLSTGGSNYLFSGAAAASTRDLNYNSDYKTFLYSINRNSIYSLSDTSHEDDGVSSEKYIVCPHIFDGTSLNNLVISRVRLDMENPAVIGNFRVGLSISRDGGKTYGTEMLQNLSTTAEGISRCEWRRLGIARDYVFKFRFPDAGKIAIIGAYVETHLANR